MFRWNPRNKISENVDQNATIATQGDAFENIVCKIEEILSRPQWFSQDYVYIAIDKFMSLSLNINM